MSVSIRGRTERSSVSDNITKDDRVTGINIISMSLSYAHTRTHAHTRSPDDYKVLVPYSEEAKKPYLVNTFSMLYQVDRCFSHVSHALTNERTIGLTNSFVDDK